MLFVSMTEMLCTSHSLINRSNSLRGMCIHRCGGATIPAGG